MKVETMQLLNGIPQVGYGTWARTGDEGVKTISAALEIGYRHLDTAQTYGTEESVGRAVSRSGLARPDVFITTKVAEDNLGRDTFLPSVRESLDKLRVDAVDLLLIHWPSTGDAVPFDHYVEALGEAKSIGYTRLIGVSNFTKAMVDRAQEILGKGELATNQVEVHPFLQNRDLRKHCEAAGIVVTAYMPLAKGKVGDDPTIVEIAARIGCEPAQVSLAFLLGEGLVVIPASGNRERMRANFLTTEISLSADDIAAIRACERGGRMIKPAATFWDR
ncbi:aldo/keto reductase [Rhizobium sp. CF142]|uniref:aldo/keto reductase n=1 Tax=Rhizobium sp. CF142 TaxID=1144314 RepID=UPI00026EF69C|nr:aldo/keto reductase [Rhizobium sp. CF142]EJJ27114.1 aldo/keto reductase, diketogulonate reductase [Rhizobium sp. CF142]